MKIRISEQKMNIICKTKYLELKLDDYLAFKYNLEKLKVQLNRATSLL